MLLTSYAHRHYMMATKKKTTSVPAVSVLLYPPIGKVGEPMQLICPSADSVASAIWWYLGNDTKGIQRSATDCSPSGSPPIYNLELYNFTCDKNHNIYSMTILQLQSSDRDQCWKCSYSYKNITASKKSSSTCIMMEPLTEVLVSMFPRIGIVGLPLQLTCRLKRSVGDIPREITWHFRKHAIKLLVANCSIIGPSSWYNQDRYNFTCYNHNNTYSMSIPSLLSSDNGTCWSCSVLENISSTACIRSESYLNKVLAINTVSVPMSPNIIDIGLPSVSRNTVSLSMSPETANIGLPLDLICRLHQSHSFKPSDITWYRGNETKGIKHSATDCSPSGSSLLYDLDRYRFTCDLNDNIYRMRIPRLLDSDNGTCWSCGVAYNNFPAPNISSPACIMTAAIRPAIYIWHYLAPMLFLLFLMVVFALIGYFIFCVCKEKLMANRRCHYVNNSFAEIELTESGRSLLRPHSRTINQEPDVAQHTLETKEIEEKQEMK